MPSDPMLGRRLNQYRIIEKIGEGGMGKVYAAEDTRLDRRVALKFLSGEAPDAQQLARFEREAKAAAALNHPNILAVHDLGSADGVPYVVMELLQGRTMRALIQAGPVKVVDAVRYTIDVTKGLGAAHSLGICHRDVKPENIFITADDHVKVLDFGLARVRPELTSDETLAGSVLRTSPGTVMGTPGYMAPEQALGGSDHRSDIFSVGAILFELLTGQRAFPGATLFDVLHATVNRDPDFALLKEPAVSADLARVARQCLAKRQEDRYQSAAEVRQALAGTLDSVVRPRSSVQLEQALPLRSVAVLPLRNLSPDPEMDYFSDGVTEDIINVLGGIRSLQVAARTSCFAFKGKHPSMAEVGAALGVSTVLEGSVRRSGERLRVTAQLVNVSDGFQLWSDRYDRQLDDVFAIQDDIAQNIARSLKLTFGALQQAAGVRRGTDDLEAYDLFLKGRAHMERRGDGIARGLELFQRALARDPGYALAYAAIAEAFMLLASYDMGLPSDWMPKAKAAAAKAIELDRSLAEGHNLMAMASLFWDHDWDKARSEFDRALELNPNLVSARCWKGLLYWTFVRGNSERALAETARAMELDPIAYNPALSHGQVLSCFGRTDEALATSEEALARDPTAFLLYRTIGVAHSSAGRYEDAAAAFEKGSTLSGRHPWFLSELGGAYARLGRVADAERLQSELTARAATAHISALSLAVIPTSLGRFDEAAAWIERAYEDREPTVIIVARWPTFRDLRAHPRVQAVVARLGLDA